MTLYSLKVNGQLICEVTIDSPAWLPFRPKLNRVWMRGVLARTLKDYTAKSETIVKA